jgi:hypothetical protein
MNGKRRLNVIDAGHVRDCGATDCAHNDAHECKAPNGITIVFHRTHADCGTYTRGEPHT